MVCRPPTSVIIPTYNRPDFAINAVKSVINQSETPEELIMIDDGSSEDYSKVKTYLSTVDINTEFMSVENQGAAKARNIGAKMASGDVLMFLDDDDQWRSKKIKRQNDLFQNDNNVGMVYSGGVLKNMEGDVVRPVNTGETGDLSKKIMIKNIIGSTSAVAIKKDIFNRVGGFDPELPGNQDWDLWIRACQHTMVDADPNRTVEWIRHKKNHMTAEPSRYTRARKMIIDKHYDKYSQLSYLDQRRAKAYQYAGLADRYSNAGSLISIKYATKSVLSYPTLRGLTEFFPDQMVAKLRNITGY
jgi:glycosyltransferase involved in cell wall biosynthesis